MCSIVQIDSVLIDNIEVDSNLSNIIINHNSTLIKIVYIFLI